MFFSKKKETIENNKKDADVKILGGGCSRCNALEENAVEALIKLGMDTEVCHVKDFSKIAEYGVMSTPALVYKEKVLVSGRVATADEIAELLKKKRLNKKP